MTIDRIAELRQAQTICLLASNDTNITRKEFEELLDNAEMLERGRIAGYIFTCETDAVPVPQAAVLAALRGKEKER